MTATADRVAQLVESLTNVRMVVSSNPNRAISNWGGSAAFEISITKWLDCQVFSDYREVLSYNPL